jgi:beta-galactosidase
LLDNDWLFGGKLDPAAVAPAFDDSAFAKVTLPHCVAPLSWRGWQPAMWQDVWIYRRHFTVPPEARGQRLFLRFDRVMEAATPTINGHTLEQHLGGFLPFEREITGLDTDKDNVLSVAVDGRWLDIPPAGSPKGPPSVDYMLPAGITGAVRLCAVPQVFLSDVYAKPVDVLDAKKRRLELTCTLDSGNKTATPIKLLATLQEQGRVIARTSSNINVKTGSQEVRLMFGNLDQLVLWDVENPKLYDVVVELQSEGKTVHQYKERVGFREARFTVDGFFLNGQRVQLFGLNRHELYPYMGFSAPDRAMRRDAEIVRKELNCNIVRCSHYPQSRAFLDACDELGLMVWEETPGWGYLGDEAFQEQVVRNVGDMVKRDRNRPSVVIWGVRVNESRNDPALYERTRALAKSLDDTRATSGSMTSGSIKTWTTEWHEDVLAYDDYHSAGDGTVAIRPPDAGVPYMLAETVGQFNYAVGHGFDSKYERTGDPVVQMRQALWHAQAHSKVGANPKIAGAIAWCAFEYASLINAAGGIKYPGVSDVFRIPKLGASFYLAQVDASVRPVIEPNFYWDFGPQTPSGPGKQAAIFSNCDRLELFLNGKLSATLHPDQKGYPNLKHSPFFADLKMDGASPPELRIDGYVKEKLVLSRSFSPDRTADRLHVYADDSTIQADGCDATRVAFAAVDKFGAPRPFVTGQVTLALDGPGVIVGDNPFDLTHSGGVGAVWIKSIAGRTGKISIAASHASLGRQSVEIHVAAANQETT